MTSAREPLVPDHDAQEAGAESHLVPARLRARWLPQRSLLWMIPAAAALAGLVVFLPGSVEERPEAAKPAAADAPQVAETPAVAGAPQVAEASADDGPETTGSFGRDPSLSLNGEGKGAAVLGAAPPSASAPPAIPGPGESTRAPRTSSDAPMPPQGEPTHTAALPPASRPRTAGRMPEPGPANGERLQPSLNLAPEEIALHLARGEERLKEGDLAAARLYFERVALAGDHRGALGMAQTYDPAVLAGLPVLGPQADPVAAKTWYDRAASQRAGG